MPEKKKYLIIIIGTLALFLYIMSTEVIDRSDSVIQLYDELQQKEQNTLNPEQLAEKRMSLTVKKAMLMSTIMKGSGTYDQSETGVFEFLNASAKEAGIRFESLTPIASRSVAQIKDIGFKISFAAGYHQVGKLLNGLETGAMFAQMKKLDLTAETIESERLQVNAEGVVYVIAK